MTEEQLLALIQQLKDALQAKIDEQAGATTTQFTALNTEIATLKGQITASETQLREYTSKANRPGKGGSEETTSIGRMFTASPEYAADKKNGKSATLNYDFAGSNVGGKPVATPHGSAPVRVVGNEPLDILDFMNVMPTVNGSIDYTVYDFGNNAGPQGMNDVTYLGDGGEFNKSTFVPTPKNAPIITFGHSTDISKQLYEDDVALAQFIDTKMQRGLKKNRLSAILSGGGGTGTMLGIRNVPGIQVYDPVTRGIAADTDLDALRRAKSMLSDYEIVPNLIVLNPKDKENLDLQKNAQGQYLFQNGDGTVWGAHILETSFMPENNFLMGDFFGGADFWDRQEGTVEASNSHNGNFTKKLITLINDARGTVTVSEPKAFVKGVLPGGTAA